MDVEHHITIGKQLINRIGVKTIHPKHSQSCHCEERKPRGNSVRTAPTSIARHHAYAPRTTPCHCEPQSGAAMTAE
ncbi:MAG: hypothetical protein O3A82_17450 [Verrucomicrobia bacterium]|nr:hypothetical protein [Verrucomicrobiota bacterium]MDA1048696.1 hypothetical protein [Verrucomicrobiota bacterium]